MHPRDITRMALAEPPAGAILGGANDASHPTSAALRMAIGSLAVRIGDAR